MRVGWSPTGSQHQMHPAQALARSAQLPPMSPRGGSRPQQGSQSVMSTDGWNNVVESRGGSMRQQHPNVVQLNNNSFPRSNSNAAFNQPYQQPVYDAPRSPSPASVNQPQRPSDVFFGPPSRSNSTLQQPPQQPSRLPSFFDRTVHEVNNELQTPMSVKRVPSLVTWNLPATAAEGNHQQYNNSYAGAEAAQPTYHPNTVSPRHRPLSPLTIADNVASAANVHRRDHSAGDDYARMQSPHRHSGGSFGSGLTLSTATSSRPVSPLHPHGGTHRSQQHEQQPGTVIPVSAAAGDQNVDQPTFFPRAGSSASGRHSRTQSGEPVVPFPSFQPIDTEFSAQSQRGEAGGAPERMGTPPLRASQVGERSHRSDGSSRFVDPASSQQMRSAEQASPQRAPQQQLAARQQQQQSPPGPSMLVMHPRASSAAFSRNHWTSIHPVASAPVPGDASQLNGTSLDITSAQLEHAQAQLKRSLKEKNEEIMKLRASLIVALQCYAYTPAGGRPVSAAERRFLSAVTSAVENDDDTPPQLIVDQPPAHVQGIPSMPLPLEINSIMGQFSGYLQMLETEEKTIFKKSWKPRFVVADQHGITIFRDEAEFKLHAFHKAVMTIPYHDLEFFVPSFHDATIPEMLERAKAGEDASIAALTQMNIISQQYAAADQKNAYFGFIAKQTPNSQTKNVNPQIVFRSRSVQEHSDWAHFLAKCFNIRLYRDMFPMMLAETMFGLISKESQVTPAEFGVPIETQTDDVHVTELEDPNMMSPPPPPPDGMPGEGAFLTAVGGDDLFGEELGTIIVDDSPKFTDATTVTDLVSWRVSASQTDDLAQWISSAPTDSNEVHTDESAALQRHIHALEEQCKLLRAEWDEVKIERDEAVDHATAVQQSLQVAERETKRLRQQVLEDHSNTLDIISQAQQSELDDAKLKQSRLMEMTTVNAQLSDNITELSKEVDSLKSQLTVSQQTVDDLKVELTISQEAFAEQLKALADKAVADMDMLHSEILRTKVPDSTASPPPPMFSPPRGMLLEGMTADYDASPSREGMEHDGNDHRLPAGAHRIGSLEVLSNHMGDVQFNVHLNEEVCHIAATHELRDQLRKVWKLKCDLVDGEIELSARLRWDDEDGGSDAGSSVGLPEKWDDDDNGGLPAPASVRYHQHTTTTVNTSSILQPAHNSTSMKSVIGESTQGLLDRLQKATPATALTGRVALSQSHHRPPFVPYV